MPQFEKTKIHIVNVLPTYGCNLSCLHCLFSHKRTGKDSRVINIEDVKRVFKILKKEGAEEGLRVEWYGGEVSMLDPEFFSEGISVVREIFPKSIHSCVSNLVFADEKWLDAAISLCENIGTSYEAIRFKTNSDLYKRWVSNIKYVASKKPEIDCITLAHKYPGDTFRVIASLPFRYVDVARMMVPEDMPDEGKKQLLDYVIDIKGYIDFCKEAIKVLGREKITQATISTETNITNVIHVFPDGSAGLPGPSDLGFPYEKTYVFYRPGDPAITFAPERVKYLVAQQLACPPSCEYEHRGLCIAEFKYPNMCVGYL